MTKFFGSLGDKVGDKKLPCRVRGCQRTWLWRGSEQVKAMSSAGKLEPPARMCDLCHARAQMLTDQQIPCATPGCPATFLWNKFSQLEAILKHEGVGSPTPPRHMCADCLGKAKSLGDQQVPCRVKGCSATWTWTGRAQLTAGATTEPGATPPSPPSKMCDACHAFFEEARDQRRPCRIRGCRRTWLHTKWHQLEARHAGEKEAPERMCDECAQLLGTLADEDVACRTDGCGGTWIWRRAHKLEAIVAANLPADAPPPSPPARMCPDCQSKLSKLTDRAVPCKRTGCKGTWLWKRGTQLERWVKQAEGPETPPPQRLCDGCRHKLDDLADKPVRCQNDGCQRTWVWTRFAQLQARETGHGGKPPHHMCEECKAFLVAHPTKTIHCATCAAGILWSSDLQLKTQLGLMKEPTLCGSCKKSSAATKPVRA